MNIQPQEIPPFSVAIQGAFPTAHDLDNDVLQPLGDTFQNYAILGGSYPQAVSNMIAAYNARWHICRLLSRMVLARPDNLRLVEYMWKWKVPYQPPGVLAEIRSSHNTFQQMIAPNRGFHDFGTFLRKAGPIANAICLISYKSTRGIEYGTGFLIGPSAVLTNWHVVEHFAASNLDTMTLLFDYHSHAPLRTTTHKLTTGKDQWLMTHSPYDHTDKAQDTCVQRLRRSVTNDHLDYAVLRTDGSPGQDTITATDAKRGHISLPATVDPTHYDANQAGLFIFQHPYDKPHSRPLPQQWDCVRPALWGLNASATRILHRVNTLDGSSGSPCFSMNLDLIAIHQGTGGPPGNSFNQAVPIDAIYRDLKRKGMLAAIAH